MLLGKKTVRSVAVASLSFQKKKTVASLQPAREYHSACAADVLMLTDPYSCLIILVGLLCLVTWLLRDLNVLLASGIGRVQDPRPAHEGSQVMLIDELTS